MLVGLRDFADDPHRLIDRERANLRDAIPQRLPLDERHHIEEDVARAARIVEREDVRVTELRGDLDLAKEAPRAEARREVWAEHVDRDLSVVLQVLNDVDGRHTPTPSSRSMRYRPVSVVWSSASGWG